MEDKTMLPIIRKRMLWPDFTNELMRDDFFPVFRTNGYMNQNPAVNIIEEDKQYKVELAAPGLEKKDLHLDLKDDILTISTEKKVENEEKNENFTRHEFNYSSFCRSFTLPDTVDKDKIKASHKNGILTVYIPKKEEEQTSLNREIKIA
ncbi:MAG: Hsp20/alpha crystallin family protein [Bacteroidales bacterium]|nr:MAG: Hsp20/alpha crystallin family protein [Bacteroidales bacterium]